jgi:hypothetical protein
MNNQNEPCRFEMTKFNLHQGEFFMAKKVVIEYSGGLGTSIINPWLIASN